jgi:glycosyltransferase involved in cell wall biosynthesis
MRFADGVLAHSEHMRLGMIARGVSAERVHAADLGVDLDRFRPAQPDEQAQARSALGLPPGPMILSMRAGTELYNLDIVLEAFRIVRTRVREATLVLLRGDAPAAPRVRALLDRLGQADGVWDVGEVPHAGVARYLQAADAAVSIPGSDGSPQSVWEALAGGVPVVLSDLPQVADRVRDSGAAQMVAQRPEALAAALIELLEDVPRRQRMAHAARAWAEANVGQRPQIELLGRAYASTAQRWADAAP